MGSVSFNRRPPFAQGLVLFSLLYEIFPTFSAEKIARGHRLLAREELDGIEPMHMHVSEERIFPSGEREISRGSSDTNVHAHHAHFNPPCIFAYRRPIFGEDRSSIAPWIAIHKLDGLVEGVHVHHREHRPKDLLPRDPHVRRDIVQNRWAHKISARREAFRVTAIYQQLSTFVNSALDTLMNSIARRP